MSSIKKRFLFTLSTNIFRALLSFLTGLALGRFLGPEKYGDMSFLLGTFMGLRYLLDMGTSQAFFTFLSQKKPTKFFFTFFIKWILLQFIITVILIGLIFPANWIYSIWNGKDKTIIILSFCATFLQNTVWPVFQNIGESQRRTILIQTIGVFIALIHLITIIFLWKFNSLGLSAIFIIIILEYLFAVIILYNYFSNRIEKEDSNQKEVENFKKTLNRYLVYCTPLIPYTIFSFIFEFSDKWLLQKFNGSKAQAYYSIGMQLSYVSLIATTSIMKILWKEIAEANYNHDMKKVSFLYQRITRSLFIVACIISGFLIPWSKDLLQLIFGISYVGGSFTLMIMFLYPIHQTMGQVGGTMLLATENTRIQLTIGIIFMISSTIVSYFILASHDSWIPGLSMGSEGLALKMVFMQILQVNATAYAVSKIFKWKFDWIFQPINVIVCLFIGWISHYFVIHFSNMFNITTIIFFGSIIYLSLISIFIYNFPQLAGTTLVELIQVRKFISHQFSKKNNY